MFYRNIYMILSGLVIILFLSGLVQSAMSQNNNANSTTDSLELTKNEHLFSPAEMQKRIEYQGVSDEMRKNLNNMFNYYSLITENLASRDSINSKKNAIAMFDEITTIIANNDLDPKWEIPSDILSGYRNMIETANTLYDQRMLLNQFSRQLPDLIGTFGMPGMKWYEMQSQGSVTEDVLIWYTNGINVTDPYSGLNILGNKEVKVLRGWDFSK